MLFKQFKFVCDIIWCFLYPECLIFTFAVFSCHNQFEAYASFIGHEKIHHITYGEACSSHSPTDKSKGVDSISMSAPFSIGKGKPCAVIIVHSQ